MDAAVQPGGRGQPRRRVRRRLDAGDGEHAAATCSAQARLAAYAASSGETPHGSWPRSPARAGRDPYTPLFDFFVDQAGPQRVPGARRRTTSPPRTAPASCTSRRPSARRTRSSPTPPGIDRWSPVDDQGKFTSQVPPYAGRAGVRRQQADHRATSRSAGLLLRQDTYDAPVPALLALRHPADLQGGLVVVRRGHPVPGPDGRAEPADHLGARRTSRTARSASGWRTPGTGRSAATVSGVRRSRCGSRTTRRTRGSTSTARSTSWSATSGSGRPTCTGRSSTS